MQNCLVNASGPCNRFFTSCWRCFEISQEVIHCTNLKLPSRWPSILISKHIKCWLYSRFYSIPWVFSSTHFSSSEKSQPSTWSSTKQLWFILRMVTFYRENFVVFQLYGNYWCSVWRCFHSLLTFLQYSRLCHTFLGRSLQYFKISRTLIDDYT